MLDDERIHERIHVSREPRFVTASVSLILNTGGQVILHNTMRFDVQLAYIQPMLDEGDVTKECLVEAIRESIIATVESVIGEALDGVPIHDAVTISPATGSVMLHRETICFDLS